MNSTVPSSSMIHDFTLLGKTKGMSYQKQEERWATLLEALCSPIKLFITLRELGRCCFSGEYTLQTGMALTQASDW